MARPTNARRQTNIDTTILQFALTLEHLEDAFYKTALSTLTPQQFMDAGFGPNYFNNIQLIAQDEASHVQFLSDALTAAGELPVQPCTYNFPMSDVMSFITLSNVLEGVGTSAYLGGAPLITNPDILTAAGSILVTEALHTSLQRTALKAAPAANAFGTPLDPNAVFTLAASFIVSCPANNTALPFKAFPSLTATDPACSCEGPTCYATFLQKRQSTSIASLPPQCNSLLSTTIRTPDQCISDAIKPPQNGNLIGGGATLCRPPASGATVTFTAADAVSAGSFLTFISGLAVLSVQAQISGNMIAATIPDGISGQTYVMVTSADAQGKFDASTVLFGPAVLEISPMAATTSGSPTSAHAMKNGTATMTYSKSSSGAASSHKFASAGTSTVTIGSETVAVVRTVAMA